MPDLASLDVTAQNGCDGIAEDASELCSAAIGGARAAWRLIVVKKGGFRDARQSSNQVKLETGTAAIARKH